MYSILYVEDEPFLAKIVRESLESRDFDVYHTDHGSKAVNLFHRSPIDLCVLDIMLPGKNGYEIAEEIRAINPQIPIIFLTAKDQTQDLIHGFEAGGNDYIKKPFSMEELIVRIQNLMTLVNGQSSNRRIRKSIGLGESYSYNPDQMTLSYQEEVIELSYKENQILDLLTQHINSNIDRNDILMKVWNNDSYFNSRNLDVYIRKLRKYFDRDDRVKIITLRGIGYRFHVEK